MARHGDRTLIQFLLTMAFVLVVAIFNWLKNKSRSADTEDTSSAPEAPPRIPPPGQRSSAAPTRPPAKKSDWEEELRRLLEGEQEQPPAPPPMPPPVHHEPIPPIPPVHQEPLRPIRPVHHEAPRPAAPIHVPPLVAKAPVRPLVIEQERGLPVELAGLTASTQSYQRASELDEKVADRLRQITDRVGRHAAVQQTRRVSMAASKAVALLSNRESLRSVIMASIILGPPKGLEKEGSLL